MPTATNLQTLARAGVAIFVLASGRRRVLAYPNGKYLDRTQDLATSIRDYGNWRDAGLCHCLGEGYFLQEKYRNDDQPPREFVTFLDLDGRRTRIVELGKRTASHLLLAGPRGPTALYRSSWSSSEPWSAAALGCDR